MAIAFTPPKSKWEQRHDKDFDTLAPEELTVEVIAHNGGKSRSVIIIAPLDNFDCGKSGLLFKRRAEKKIRQAVKIARGYIKRPPKHDPQIDKYCLWEYLRGKNYRQIYFLALDRFENKLSEKFTEKSVEHAIDRALSGEWTYNPIYEWPLTAIEIIGTGVETPLHITGVYVRDASKWRFFTIPEKSKRDLWQLAFNAMQETAGRNVPFDNWVIRGLEKVIANKSGKPAHIDLKSPMPYSIDTEIGQVRGVLLFRLLYISGQLIRDMSAPTH